MSTAASAPAPPASLAWADRLRNLATVMVIGIHVSAPVAHGYAAFDSWFWWAANWWDSACRPSVPLFVMLSGFLLLGKDYPLGDFLQRRFTRVIVPSLAWMVVYNIYNHLASGQPATFAEAGVRMVENKVHYHLWFIYLIVGLYLVYPIMRPWVRTARERDYWYLFALCAMASWGYKILYVFWNISIGIYWEFFCNNLGYFVLGYYLGNKPTLDEAGGHGHLSPWPFTRRQLLWVAGGLVVLGTVATAVGTYWASKKYGHEFHPYFYDYLTPNVGLCAAGWFLLAKYTWNRRPLLDVEREFAIASFGIYFVHVLLLDFWSKVGYWQTRFHPAKTLPILTAMITLSSFVAILLVRALPGGKKIT
ncbi:MAG: acyltransferase family protein [Saprospiraceae bacterium]|nr:acyltransferase family protein [Saprospiraceae bacterium]